MNRLLPVLFLLVFASVGHADQDRARAKYEEGRVLFERGNYDAAIAAFEEANRIVPAALIHYNIGLAHDRAGRKAEAVAAYRRYLAQAPNAPDRSDIQLRIAALEKSMTPPPSEPVAGTPAPTAPPASGYYPTGDAELDRAAALDLNLIFGTPATATPPAPVR